jgi:hypothetical protein
VADALDDDPGLARSCAGDHDQRPVAVFDDGPLLVRQRDALAGVTPGLALAVAVALAGSWWRYGDLTSSPRVGPSCTGDIGLRMGLLYR